MRKILFVIPGILVLVFTFLNASAQLSSGGIPPGFNTGNLKSSTQVISLLPPDYELLKRQDDSVGSMGVPERVGVCLASNIDPQNAGSWIDLDANRQLWRLNLKVKGATGIGLYFEDFHLGKDDKLFVYSEDKSHLIGAFTAMNNRKNGLFATEPVKGESVIIELVHDINSENSLFRINEILVVYTPMTFSNLQSDNTLKNIKGDSDDCEVSTNCPEGDAWRDQINGVVRIMVKIGGTAYWCTGSVMNNTALDFRPFILTADHCAVSNGTYATAANIAQWIFFFKHEATSCEDDTPSGTKSLTGAVKLASSSAVGNNGSDFYLVELSDDIPGNYQPYYLGWNAKNEVSNSGVSIHHPAGDVKKISTYTTPLEISQWGDVPETHLMVVWSATPNGHGVTEGGSSGSPLFNANKLVIGQLTGGESDCTNLTGQDHYGRFYYSWDKNGAADSMRLRPWLDPLGSGLQTLDGSFNTKAAIAQFTADETVIPVGSYVKFTDLSINNPTSWFWEFEGGQPATSTQKQPELIYFDKLGKYNVSLTVENEFGTDSTSVEISVVPVIYPNPTRNVVNILFGNDSNAHDITVTDMAGKKVSAFTVAEESKNVEFSFLSYPAGMYMITVKSAAAEDHYKVLYTPK
ncbi:MAG: T9SS type A sorting domain-containing protein [Chloroflexota bacterium]